MKTNSSLRERSVDYLKYELKSGFDMVSFLRAVDSCAGEVRFEGSEGDRLDLKSQLTKYLFLTLRHDDAYMSGGRISCSEEDGRVLEKFLI